MMFHRYIGIDYSGAETPTSHLPGLQVFRCTAGEDATQITTPHPKARNWSRKEIACWLADQLEGDDPVLVGIDHAFSFPVAYLDRHHLRDWDEFLDDFCHHWPTYEDHEYVDFSREGNPRLGTVADGLRLTERWTSSAKCVFLFDCQGSVAKSSHAGIPWLHFLRHHPELRQRVHFWPFDGFSINVGTSVVAEVYPSIFRNRYPHDVRNDHEQDGYTVASWMRETDASGFLGRYFEPPLTEAQKGLARREGWILGVS